MFRVSFHAKVLAVGVSTVALLIAGVGPATAADSGDTTAGLVAELAPNQGRVLRSQTLNGQVAFHTANSALTVPVDPARPIQIQGSSATAGAAQPPLDVALPPEAKLGAAKVAADGTVVYQAADNGADVAVQALDNGSVRVQTIIPDADAGSQYTYEFGSTSRVMQGTDGRVFLEIQGTIVAEVAAPWAVDSNGNQVATHYVLGEHSITQVVTFTDATQFPVVADPTYISGSNCWFGCGFVAARFNRSETNRIAVGSGVVGVIGVLVQKIPSPYTVVAGTVLEIIGGSAIIWAGGAIAVNKCVEIRYYYRVRTVYGLYYSGGAQGCY